MQLIYQLGTNRSSGYPWIGVEKVTVKLSDLSNPHPIGCTLTQCGQLWHPFLPEIHQSFEKPTKTQIWKHFLKFYIVDINNKHVFDVNRLHEKIAFYQHNNEPPETAILTLALEGWKAVFCLPNPHIYKSATLLQAIQNWFYSSSRPLLWLMKNTS